jgi:hypothetical protein
MPRCESDESADQSDVDDPRGDDYGDRAIPRPRPEVHGHGVEHPVFTRSADPRGDAVSAPLAFRPRLTTTTTTARTPRASTGFTITLTATLTHYDGDPAPDWSVHAARLMDEFRREWEKRTAEGPTCA